MIVTLQTERIHTLEQVAAFVEANAPVDFQPVDRASAYEFVARMLSRLGAGPMFKELEGLSPFRRRRNASPCASKPRGWRARRRLIHRALVPRTASQAVLEGVGNSASVLVGKAGSGKTACAVEIIEGLLGRGREVLAFRLDRHVAASNTGDLGERLGLEESPVLMLAAAAETSGSAGVLVVDQLDAVSTMSGRSSEALDLVEDLLGEAKAIRGRVDIHVVVVCRSFDWDNDHRLRRLIRDSTARVAVGEFTDEETRGLLRRGGFTPSLFGEAQLRLLRVPQNLSLFPDAGFDTDTAPTFDTVTELFDRYWDAKRDVVVRRAGSSIRETRRTFPKGYLRLPPFVNSRYVSRFPIPPRYTNRMMSMVSSLRVLWWPTNSQTYEVAARDIGYRDKLRLAQLQCLLLWMSRVD